jgi:WXXGXW repeat (2 copies)
LAKNRLHHDLSEIEPEWLSRVGGQVANSAFVRKQEMKLANAVRFLAIGLLLLALPAVLSVPSAAQIGIGISVRIGPPALPVYDQPICPGPGFMWVPGYWAWDDDIGYYWVPGTWVEAPQPGLLWTPGYWGWNDGVYAWNPGYWGPTVGFYGGINYGFGYGGNGFGGGEWRGGTFFYNTAVMHVNTVTITNVYVNKTVIVNNTSHVAFNGGEGGVQIRPTPEQVAYAHQTHTPPVAAQMQNARAASQNRALFASTNHGRPAVAATAKPGQFSGKGVIAARSAGGTYQAPKMSPKEARAPAPAANRAAENHAPANRPSEAHPNNAHPAPAHPNEAHAPKPAPKPPSRESAPKPAPKANRPAPKPAAAPKPAPKPSQPKPAAKPAPRPAAKPAPPPKPAPQKREPPPQNEHK